MENVGLGGISVRLSGTADQSATTDSNGQYAFTGLRAGTYSVEISGFDSDEVGFGATSFSASVGVGESKIISFDGTYLRTAGIMGQVSVEGEGLAGVTVTLAGEGEGGTTTTDAGGLYAFSKLRAGDYSVAISGYDTDDYDFETTSMNVSVALGETANIPFDGTLLRTSGISGRVSVEGMGIDGVEVVLAGAAEATAMTSGGGQYAFAGLAEGTYVVSMMNPNEAAYSFDMTSATIVLGDAESNITNFEGTHTRTASVTGMAFIDEAPADKMYTANEPMLAHAGIPVVLQGPGVNDVMLGATGDDGSYAFEGLVAGSYRVLVNMTPEVATAIAGAGFAYKGDLTGEIVNVDAGGNAMVNFPFGITTQTIHVGASMGLGDEIGAAVGGVNVAVYASADMTGMLGEGTTDDMGMASVDFARADNTGPGGNDNLVFLTVMATGHDDLAVSDNSVIEVSYPATARVHAAPAAVTLVNTRANFQYWVKNNAMARDGDMGLEGWAADIYMGDPEAEDAMPLEDGPDNTDEDGLATFTYSVDPTTLKDGPATFTVMVQDDQSSEMYDQSDALVHTHNALAHPDMNTAEMNDLMAIFVTWTTQTLTVGVYREIDDEPGFTDYRAALGGDARPVEAVAGEMTAELLTRDERNRLRAYEYDHDGKESTDDISSMAIGADGMASFPHLPAKMEFTVRLHTGSDRVLVGETDSGDIETFGDDLDIGMSTGSFGEASGGGPEVELCSLTTARRAMECATWAYQWETGSVSGMVDGAGGASVSLTAETDNDDRGTKTGADSKKDSYQQFSISDIQDGTYTLATPNTADNSFGPRGGHDLEIYHDEAEDDDNEDTEYVGTADARSDLNFTATKLRLSIKGYVANDNGDGRARGNESMSGVTVNLLAIARNGVSADEEDTTFNTAATTETDGSGFYEFNDLTEGGEYYVEVAGGDDYMGVKDLANGPNNKSGEVMPDEYPALSEGAFALPSWNHMTNMAEDGQVTVRNSTGSVTAELENFALVFTDNNVSGTVNNLSGSNGGILVEGAMCPSYTPAGVDEEDAAVAAMCPWTQGDVFRTTTSSSGGYEFDGLTEGYYAVWFTGGGLMAANMNADDEPDDDADLDGDGTAGAMSHVTSVMGRSDYSTRNHFTVYSQRAGMGDVLATLEVTGVNAAGDTVDFAEDVSIEQGQDGTTTVTIDATVTFASEGVTIATTQSAGASARARLTTAVSGHSPSNLPFNATGADGAGTAIDSDITLTVTAGNGYNDHDYTFMVERTNPADNTPETVSVNGGSVTFANGVATATVAADADEAAIAVDLDSALKTVTASSGSDGLTGVAGTTDPNIITFTVDSPAAGSQTTVVITVTSEDGVDNVMTLNLAKAS